jgi:hypothetical protein
VVNLSPSPKIVLQLLLHVATVLSYQHMNNKRHVKLASITTPAASANATGKTINKLETVEKGDLHILTVQHDAV